MFSGTVGADGKVITNGFLKGSYAGSFTAYWLPPFSGTYTGTLGGFGSNVQVSLNISQNSVFSLQVNGQAAENGTLASLSIVPQNPPIPPSLELNTVYSYVVGATFYGGGLATGPQLSPNSWFSIVAVAQDATEQYITVSLFDPIQGNLKSGNLSKQ
jgi:hypothetical protein